MRDIVWLGPTPPDEECADMDDPGYEELARDEGERYIRLIRRTVGEEPQGAKLRIKWSDHDLGRYAEVVCEFDDRYPEAFDYAFRCENEGPRKWGGSDDKEA